MEVQAYYKWQVITTIVSSFLVLSGIIITIIHFNKSQTNQLKILEAQIEAQRKENMAQNLNSFQNSFWTKQLELYLKASTFAAELTQYPFNSSEYKRARTEFYTLFWGPMSIVEDVPVKKAMEAFSAQLLAFENGQSAADLNTLQQKSFQLARKCRESSIKRWELKEFELKE